MPAVSGRRASSPPLADRGEGGVAWTRTGSCACPGRAGASRRARRSCCRASGWGPTAWAGTPPAPRRYDGLLIAALPAPLGRQMMLNHLSELLRLPDGSTVLFGSEERAGAELVLHGSDHLTEFRLESGLPVWHYEVGGIAFEKRVVLPHMQNTVHVLYKLVKGAGTVRLKLRPTVHFRSHDAPVSAGHPFPYTLTAIADRYELVTADAALPHLRLHLNGERGAFTLE